MPWAYVHEHIANLREAVAIEWGVGGFKICYDLFKQRKLVPFPTKGVSHILHPRSRRRYPKRIRVSMTRQAKKVWENQYVLAHRYTL
jgi:hypothetical protein